MGKSKKLLPVLHGFEEPFEFLVEVFFELGFFPRDGLRGSGFGFAGVKSGHPDEEHDERPKDEAGTDDLEAGGRSG